MSYDLWFWKESKKTNLAPEDIMKKLSKGEVPSSIKNIPTDKVSSSIQKQFENVMINEPADPENVIQILWEDNSTGSLIINISPYVITVSSNNVSGEILNKIIDIMLKFNCPLYDPQINKRFDNIDGEESVY